MDAIRRARETLHFSKKKKELLRETIWELMPEDRRSTLLDVCCVGWLQRIDGFQKVQELIYPILTTFDLIATNHQESYSREARCDAQGVYWTFEFNLQFSQCYNVNCGLPH